MHPSPETAELANLQVQQHYCTFTQNTKYQTLTQCLLCKEAQPVRPPPPSPNKPQPKAASPPSTPSHQLCSRRLSLHLFPTLLCPLYLFRVYPTVHGSQPRSFPARHFLFTRIAFDFDAVPRPPNRPSQTNDHLKSIELGTGQFLLHRNNKRTSHTAGQFCPTIPTIAVSFFGNRRRRS